MTEYLFTTLKNGFIGDIYNENYESLSDGGPRCYLEMTSFFKTSISICSVLYYIFNGELLFFRLSRPVII